MTSPPPLDTTQTERVVHLYRKRPWLLRYGIAVMSVALAVVLKLQLDALIGGDTPFLLFFIALLLSAIYGGIGPGLLATGLAVFTSDYFFLDPGVLLVQDIGQNLRLVIFGLEGVLVSWLSVTVTTARQQTRASVLEVQHHQERLHQSEERFRLLVDGVKDYAIYMLDTAGHVVSWNAGAERITGYGADEIVGQDFACFFTNEDRAHGKPESELRRAAQDGRVEVEGWRVRKDGSRFWAHIVLTAIYDPAGTLHGFAKVTRDVTERRQAEGAMRRSQARLAAIINSAMDAIITVNAAQCIEVFNAAAEQMFRCSAAEAIGQPIARFIPELFRQVHAAHIEGFGRTGTTGRSMRSPGTSVALRADGEEFPIEATISQDEVDSQKLYTVIIRDITERVQAEESLRHHAFYDPLTQLPNRALFTDRLQHALDRARRHPERLFAVLFLDLDRFKTINDSLGHLVGDQLLVAISRRLVTCLRACDTVARLGGDEFLVLLEDLKEVSDATHIAGRILDALAMPFYLQGHTVVANASIGIVFGSNRYARPEDLVRDADIAMYRAKSKGKARYELFDAAMHVQVMHRMQLQADLRQALDRREFTLHYQPIVSLRTGEIVSVEALVRWHHPMRGLVPPEEFIPLAEETGLIEPLWAWILRTACAQLKAWHQSGASSLCIAVNCSFRQFRRQNMSSLIDRVLQETGVRPQHLCLELPESGMLANIEACSADLQNLKDMGLQLWVDDFGTGCSSLGSLKSFPITILKIDRSFVQDIVTNPNNAAMVMAIIAMGHSLDLQVIAEGVETAEQLAFLQAQGCDAIQGYLCSHPQPAERLTALLQQGMCDLPIYVAAGQPQ